MRSVLDGISTPEFDYNILMSLLSEYSQPWAKIRYMLRKGEMIRVKKGLYVRPPDHSQPYSEAVLANLIYGPSYLSFEWALSWHGMIPERVEQVTSASLKPSKTFSTPIGTFTYRRQPRRRYAAGFTRVELDARRSFLVATKEKALVDTIADCDVETVKELRSLLQGLRVNESEVRALKPKVLSVLAERFGTGAVAALAALVEELSR